ncbi:MAG: glycosyl transferase family 2 [Firmicutes bacterium]|nr:glycosyl transferase family 2 [Bacillota bacterium]
MQFEDLMIKAQEFVEADELQKAIDIYLQILRTPDLKEHYGAVYFAFFPVLFSSGLYDEALKMLIQAYELGYKPAEILEIINDGYYQPNIAELKHLYYENVGVLQKAYQNVEVIIDFTSLPLQFIPVSDVKFYIFDRKKKEFAGVFSLDASSIATETTDEDYVVKNVYDINHINSYEKKAQNSMLYLVYDPAEEFLSYLQVVKFGNIIANPRIKLFFSLIDFVVFFDKQEYAPSVAINMGQEDRYLKFMEFNRFVRKEKNTEVPGNFSAPNTYKTESTAESDKIIHYLKNMPWNKRNNKILLSIAMPTWNRGHRALASVQHMLTSKEYEEIEFVVCDNNSADVDGKYKEISLLQDSRLKYYKNEINVGFGGNVIRAVERAQGKFVYLISDEDFVNIEALPRLLEILRSSNDSAVLQGSIQPQNPTAGPGNSYEIVNDHTFEQGYEALFYAGFAFNYLSGAIYNRDLVMQKKLYEKYINKVNEYIIYPHLYLEALLCVAGKYKFLAEVICLEGAPESVMKTEKQSFSVAYSYEGRLEQHAQFTNMLDEALEIMGCNIETQKGNLYLKLCNKLARLILLVHGYSYHEQGRNIQILARHAYYYCLRLSDNIFRNIYIKKEFEKQLKIMFDSRMKELVKM